MRENSYENIRQGIVNRSGEMPNQKPTTEEPKKEGHGLNEGGVKTDTRSGSDDEYRDDEYNPWS